ncbi:CAP domain-containing protein [Paenibacillus fonticola]|uniref:CAP domain-containing protein n=1 Tax=Paenibacillus fonticola TaxID=379896 RepID=UPI000360292F|nr:CAP domain-containing protein [Paenibacillus fonticola]
MGKSRWLLKIAGVVGITAAVWIGVTKGIAAASPMFTDVPGSHWAYEKIMWSKDQGIASGYPDGSFKPSKSVTEAEFLVMLLRTYPELQVEDTKADEIWYTPYYRLAKELNLQVNQQPHELITRGHAAQLMTGTMGKALTVTEAVQFMLDEGLAEGKNGSGVEGFAPKDTLTRAEAQTFFYRLQQGGRIEDAPAKEEEENVVTGQEEDKTQQEGQAPSAMELLGVQIGDSEADVIAALGQPNRKDKISSDMTWYIYNRDLKNYAQIGIMNQEVAALFSNGTGWRFGGDNKANGLINLKSRAGKLWEESTGHSNNVLYYQMNDIQITLFTDNHENDRVDGVFVTNNSDFDYVYRINVTEDTLKAYELQVLDLTNSFRVNKGLKPLIWNEKAAVAARLHSEDMGVRDFFAHRNPDGKSVGDRMAAQGLTKFKAIGENIAAGHTSAIDAHYGWLNSLGHRNNMLTSDYTALGVGVKFINDVPFYTQNFYTAR